MKQTTKNRLLAGAALVFGIVAVLQGALIFKLARGASSGEGDGVLGYLSRLFYPSSPEKRADVQSEENAGDTQVLVMGEDMRRLHEEINSAFEKILEEINFGPGAPVGRPAPLSEPWADMRRLQEQIDAIFRQSFRVLHAGDMDEMLGRGWEGLSGSSAMDVRDRGGHYEITMHLPGAVKDAISVHADGRLLTVIAAESGGQSGAGSNFRTRIMLPEPVSAEKTEAVFEDGVLRVKAPKAGGGRQNKIVVL